jgi:hypothetical protein
MTIWVRKAPDPRASRFQGIPRPNETAQGARGALGPLDSA